MPPASLVRCGAIVSALLLLTLALPAPAGARMVSPAPAAHEGHEHLSFRTIGVAQGLPQYGVYGIARDRYGFMWFATLDGLARFDGQAFQVYRAEPGNPNAPSSSLNWGLYADREGVIWAGTLNSGLVSFDPRTERFTHFRHDPADPASLSDDAVRAIYQDPAGALWVGTLNGGLNRLDPATGRFARYRHDPANPSSLSDDRVEAIVDDGAGGVWVGTFGGLDWLDPATGRFVRYRQGPNAASGGLGAINALLRDRAGNLWVGVSEGGLYRLDQGSRRAAVYLHDPDDPSSLSSDAVTAIAEDSAGTIWVGTYGGGLNRFDGASGTFTRFRRALLPQEGLASDNIMSLYPSDEGLLWVGTEERGVTLVDRQARPFQITWGDPGSAPQPDRLRAGVIRSLVEDRDGALWVGFSDVGLDHLDRASGQVTHYSHDPNDPGSPLGNRPQAMLVTRDGTLWIGYYGGLDRFDRASNTFIHYRHDPDDPAGLGHNNIFALCEGRDGGLWIATRGGGLDRLDPASGTFTHYRHDPDDPASLGSDSVLSVAEEQSGALWVGTEDAGLDRLDPASGTFTHYRHNPDDPASLGSDTVAMLFVDQGSTLWAATWDSGLDRFEPASGTFVRYHPNDRAPNSKINGISADSAGNLWLSSNSGLIKLDPRSGATTSFTSESAGLPYGGYPLNSAARSRSGEILLGGVDSIVTFFPEQISTRAETPPVAFTRFLVKNEPVTIGGTSLLQTSINETSDLTLSSQDQVIRLEFSALDYRAPRAVRYRYRLEGFDQGWVETGSEDRAATYTNLEPGSYVLRITATNGDGVWGEAERRIRITITPPWWRTWWFTMLAGIALVVGGVGTFRYRLHRLHVQKRRLETEVATQTNELTAVNASLAVEVAERSRAEAAARAARDDLDRQLTIERALIVSRDLDTLFGRILEQIAQVVDFVTAGIYTIDGDDLVLRAIRSNYLQPRTQQTRIALERVPLIAQALRSDTASVIANPGDDRSMMEYLGELFGNRLHGSVWLAAPLLVQGQPIGLLLLANTTPGCYGEAEIRQLEAFTSPIALALQNASLHQSAQEAAVIEERNRLARELHDAVTQTLFSATLIAEALPEVLRQSPARASTGVIELRRLTSGALAEMRTLLLELRPKALTEKPLGQLLRLLCTSTNSRTAIPLNLTVARDCTLEAPVQLAFYRVAQEALNNVVKHAEARQVIVHLDCTAAEATLRVSDDGQGFDSANVRPDSLGLGIMRERAAEIGASLTIFSTPSEGTSLTLHWQMPTARAGAPCPDGTAGQAQTDSALVGR